MIDHEKLGAFYLGRRWDPASGAHEQEPLLYASKHLTTHAMVVGMTGSGKTGLSIALLEEAAIDGVPCIAIDPKGDLGNLLLTFPGLSGPEFRPWVDPEEAARRGISLDDLGAITAESWKNGLAASAQDAARIQRLRDAAEVDVYTPGSTAGRPLALLRSFDAPRAAAGEDLDDEVTRDRVSSVASGLLGLLGSHVDPLQSREHTLISRIVHDAWAEGRDVDLAGLITAIQRPSFTRVGVLDLDAFFPEKERGVLAMQLNNLLASPGSAAWMEGEALNIQRLLYGLDGKPKISVLSIAHLSDDQRMFFVSTLLHALVGWMRAQAGTSSLRAILLMDEIHGYFPPVANPPSKPPMLTLLKQARAFGLGVVLATQNPVDLDYKGLSNCGTWFIGRLQTERDKLRVLDGLEGAALGGAAGGGAAGGGTGLDRATLDRLISSLGSRVFLLHNVHQPGPTLFQTRWTLSFLRGPLTRSELRTLTRERGAQAALAGPLGLAGGAPDSARASGGLVAPLRSSRPMPAAGIEERFLGAGTEYQPFLCGSARVHYVDAKLALDVWEDITVSAPVVDDERVADWSRASVDAGGVEGLAREPNPEATFGELARHAVRKTAAAEWRRSFATWIYREKPAELLRCETLKLTSLPGESEAGFRTRVGHLAHERRDARIEAMRTKIQPKIDALDEKVRKAEARVQREQSQATSATVSAAATWGNALFGALFGGGRSTVSKVATAARSTSRTMDQRGDVAHAEADLQALLQQRAQVVADLQAELSGFGEPRGGGAPVGAGADLVGIRVPARKADTEVLGVWLVWRSEG